MIRSNVVKNDRSAASLDVRRYRAGSEDRAMLSSRQERRLVEPPEVLSSMGLVLNKPFPSVSADLPLRSEPALSALRPLGRTPAYQAARPRKTDEKQHTGQKVRHLVRHASHEGRWNFNV